MRIDQYLPGFAPHDAIGNHTLQARRILREAGFDSEIWAEHILPLSAARPVRTRRTRAGRARNACSSTILRRTRLWLAWLQARAEAGETLVSDYHNITPSQYFARWEPAIAQALIEARQELAMLAPHVDFSFADSGYNEAELVDCGYRQTLVCPLLVDLDEYHLPPDPGALDRLRRRRETSGTQWLFVGRVAPNKCQHDVVGAFAVYRRVFDPAARLTIVGGGTSVHYLRALESLVGELELGDSVELLNGLSDAELLAHWAVADVFVCLSEHEGFCVPILEAMELGVPVVAYPAAAVPETLGDAGVLVEDKDPLTVAMAVDEACRPARPGTAW